MEGFIKFSKEEQKRYEKAGYRFVGENKHSATQLCRWTKSRVSGKRNCYKSIYGIKSHRCIQFTPSLDFCDFSCTFCWRSFGENRFKSENKWDEPKEIVDGIINAQRNLLSGFGSIATKQNFAQSMDPHHVAISLDGEPTLYPKIADLIKEIKNRKMTVFIVTNGTMPNRIKEMLDKDAEPNNLSISVYATNEEDYKKITNSMISNSFEKVKESLELMKYFKHSRTIMRTTITKGLNDHNASEFSDLVNIYKPKFVQLKGYSWLGESKKRLKLSNMPTMKDIEEYGKVIEKKTGYIPKLKDKTSRVIIYLRDEEVWKWNSEKIKEQDEMLNSRPVSKFRTKRVLTK